MTWEAPPNHNRELSPEVREKCDIAGFEEKEGVTSQEECWPHEAGKDKERDSPFHESFPDAHPTPLVTDFSKAPPPIRCRL